MSSLSQPPTPGVDEPDADPGVDTAAIAAILRARLFDEAPHRIGRFAVVQRLGAGGMGVVYGAFDAELDRRVAIKLMFAGADDRGRLAREAQIMARLNHPNVAQVYEVGRHGDATYVAMEYVRGRTLRAWATQSDPTLRERLAALVQAGRGLAAAHAAGVIHRDFKPDNAMMGDDGRVRVLDFGLARDVGDDDAFASEMLRSEAAIDAPATPPSTAHGAGTPAYMAPEQWRGEAVDARTDVYSFCVSAWEILSGRRPFAEASLPELRRGAPRDLVAQGSLPRWIERVLRRGLAADRDARPQGMDALLDELTRDPAVARRRLLMLGVGTAAIGGVLLWQRAVGLQREAACEDAAASIEESWNAERGDAIAQAFADTGLAYAPDTFARARARLDAYATAWSEVRLDVCRAAEGDEVVAATACLDDGHSRLQVLLERLAAPLPAVVPMAVSAAASLPDPHACADPHAAALLAGRTAMPAESQRRLVEIEVMRQTAAYEEALLAADELIAAADHPSAVARVQLVKGEVLRALGRHAESRTAFESAYYDAGAAGDDATAMEAAIDLIAVVGSMLAQDERGREWARLARMYVTRLGLEDHPLVAALESNVGLLLRNVGEQDGALDAHRRALAIRERIFGDAHPSVAGSWAYVGNALADRGDIEGGIAALRRSLEIAEPAYGPDHPEVARILHSLSEWLLQRGEYDEAQTTAQRAFAIREATLGVEHESTGSSVMLLGELDLIHGRYESALANFHRALEIAEASFAPDHPRIAGALKSLGRAFEMNGDYDTAMRHYRRSLEIQERAVGPDDASLVPMLGAVGFLQLNNRQLDEAVAMLGRAEQILLKQFGPNNGDRAIVISGIATAETSRKRPERAIELLEEALAICERAGLSADQRADVEYQLGRALGYAGRDFDRALTMANKARESWLAMGPAKAEYVGYAEALIGALEKAKREGGSVESNE
jgi:tetratricopeptide (TPR) repeat protein/tRNA A-37 threonylcarbamoyl transferase component Bud32